VIDLRSKNAFTTNPRNVGGIRDFNRIDAEGLDPNILENALGRFETEASQSIRRLVEGGPFAGETRNTLMNLMALFAIRSPEIRESFESAQRKLVELTMELALASEERWNHYIAELRKKGEHVDDTVTFENARRFLNDRNYTIEFSRERQIQMELGILGKILAVLDARQWSVLRTQRGSGPIITSDSPVSVAWVDPESVQAPWRYHPGIGVPGTLVSFPVSRTVALFGEFDAHEVDRIISPGEVALINAQTIHSAISRVFAPGLDFEFRDESGKIVSGAELLKVKTPPES
jgi:hypothetical protein